MVKHKLAIDYNASRPIGVLSPDPYNFLILDMLFDDIQIVTPRQQNWLRDLPLKAKVTSLNLNKLTPGENIGKFVTTKKFIEMFKADPRRKYPLYSPLDPPYKVNPLAYLMNSPTRPTEGRASTMPMRRAAEFAQTHLWPQGQRLQSCRSRYQHCRRTHHG